MRIENDRYHQAICGQCGHVGLMTRVYAVIQQTALCSIPCSLGGCTALSDNTTQAIIMALLLVGTVVIFGNRHRFRGTQTSVVQEKPVTFEQKLEALAACGLELAKPFTLGNLLDSNCREDYEEPGFEKILFTLGMTEEEAPWRNHCVNLWHFDTECIVDDGSYVRIVERMVEMTQGSLVLENVRDHVDIENDEVWFAYSFQGVNSRVDCKVNDDWVDPGIFIKFVELLYNADPFKVFIYYNPGDQTCILGCVTRDQLKALNDLGIEFVPYS